MRVLILAFLLCFLCECAPRRKIEDLPQDTPAGTKTPSDLSPEEKEQVEAVTREAETLAKEDEEEKETLVEQAIQAVTIEFIDLQGFDAPRLVIKTAALQRERGPAFRVVYDACPVLAKGKQRSDTFLFSCVQGFTRETVFMLPLYAGNADLHLKLCEGEDCFFSKDFKLQNRRPLDLESEDPQLDLADNFRQYHDKVQELLQVAGAIFAKIPEMRRFVNECHHNLSDEDVSTLNALSKLTLPQLEEMILATPTEELLRYLPQKTIEELVKKGTAKKKAETLFSTLIEDPFDEKTDAPLTFSDLFADFNFFIFAVWGLHGTYQDIKSLYSWSQTIRKKRTVQIDGKEVVLAVHKKTGFLVHPTQKGWPIEEVTKFYWEDPVTKDVMRAGDGSFSTVKPHELGLKYVGGRYYEYDYKAEKYKVGDASGNLINAPSRMQDLKALMGSGGLSLQEKVLKRYHDPKLGQFGILEMEGGKPVFLNQSEFLKMYPGRNFSDYKNNLAIHRPEYADLDDPAGILQKPMTAVRLGWSTIRFGVAVVSMYALINRMATNVDELQLASSKFCRTPVSLKSEMERASTAKANLFFLKAGIASLL